VKTENKELIIRMGRLGWSGRTVGGCASLRLVAPFNSEHFHQSCSAVPSPCGERSFWPWAYVSHIWWKNRSRKWLKINGPSSAVKLRQTFQNKKIS
jgi:hypothetical protein